MTNLDITTSDLGLKAKGAGGECACGGHDHAPAEHDTVASSTQAGAAGPIEVGGAGDTHGGNRCACGCGH